MSNEATSQAANGAASSRDALLEVRNVDKSFGGTHALRQICVGFRAGEVHAIVGENGAGKSTLVKIFSGVYPTGSYNGELYLSGERLAVRSILEAESAGIFLVPQDLQVVPRISIAENLFLNREPSRYGIASFGVMYRETKVLLEEFGIRCDPTDQMSRLTTAQQQLVIITRAMMHGVRVLALDEPTAALTEAESAVLFQHLASLKERGIAIIYISHRLDEIVRICDRVSVLRDGSLVDHIGPGETQNSKQRIVRAMIGRDVVLESRTKAVIGAPKLEVRSLSLMGVKNRPPKLRAIDLIVRAGEVVGVFGAVGCGSDEIVGVLLGTENVRPTGTILVNGRPVAISSPAHALDLGIGYLPGDRQRDGAFLNWPIAQNIDVLVLNRLARWGTIKPSAQIKLVGEYYSRFKIKARSVDDSIRSLSGGNQQKVILARILSANPEIFLFHDPTQGVDIATKKEVYTVIDELARQGKAILLVSSDLEEVLVTSDKIVVLHAGRVALTCERGNGTQETILAAATSSM
jgi:putative multiple sugar transport system ATP-binding protein